MPFGGLLTIGLIAAGGSIASSAISSSGAKSAANTQAQAGQQALDFQKTIFDQQQANQKPFQEAGVMSLASLMDAIKSGKFGLGSNADFVAPTLEQARNEPGYEFTRQQGSKGILQGAAAAGGAISGGTLRALDTFGSNLADTTYGNIYDRALKTYGANLSKQAQEFGQLFAPAQLGENAVANINQTGTGVAQNVGNLMTGIGNAQAAGQVGSSNAIAGGISGATNGILQSVLLGNLNKPGSIAPGQSLPGTSSMPNGYLNAIAGGLG